MCLPRIMICTKSRSTRARCPNAYLLTRTNLQVSLGMYISSRKPMSEKQKVSGDNLNPDHYEGHHPWSCSVAIAAVAILCTGVIRTQLPMY